MQVREQAVWALGNIAGDNHAYRDGLIDGGVIQMLMDVLYNVRSLTHSVCVLIMIESLATACPQFGVALLQPLPCA